MVSPSEQESIGSNGSNERIAANQYASVGGSKSNNKNGSPRKSFSVDSKVRDVEERPLCGAKGTFGVPSRKVVAKRKMDAISNHVEDDIQSLDSG